MGLASLKLMTGYVTASPFLSFSEKKNSNSNYTDMLYNRGLFWHKPPFSLACFQHHMYF
jgi:hypothetical protein